MRLVDYTALPGHFSEQRLLGHHALERAHEHIEFQQIVRGVTGGCNALPFIHLHHLAVRARTLIRNKKE
jgi:hypothetical protein